MQSLAALSLLAAGAAAETVHGVVVFTRHGDRTTKHYGSQQLTPLGASQNYQVGSSYRARYLSNDSDHQILGISPDEYKSSQIYASAPNQGILSNTATAFLQGLYPPLTETNEDLATTQLNNGSDSTAPLEGYQYVLLHGVGDESESTIWIKGDDACPAYQEATASFADSDVFQQRLDDTKDFYLSMKEYLNDVYDADDDYLSYENAYDIWDLLNVARIHNASTKALDISDEDMFQLKTLGDSHEFGSNYNASQPARAIGARTLSGGVLAQLNETVSSEGKLKFSLLAGSYDTFLAFFGAMGLVDLSKNFTGLPEYAGTMAFELFSEGRSDADAGFPSDADLRVRWLFKNGTDGELTSYPLFGNDDDVMSWDDFKSEMEERGIGDVGTWCDICSATESFCAAYAEGDGSDGSEAEKSAKGGVSPAVGGVIGAVVTLAVVALVGGVVFAVLRKRKASAPVAAPVSGDQQTAQVAGGGKRAGSTSGSSV
ncbi:hypothetical protein N3K66_003959 [Trichothecium roseum]|uniref:Uncharacterized protein n=1 Tax=Trichothecium roseum TaxID=47278 RepID=A0ACC0V7N3_9HYPO|nr:hypothetical protein N3K66_003959 [Trichothecium roseum]